MKSSQMEAFQNGFRKSSDLESRPSVCLPRGVNRRRHHASISRRRVHVDRMSDRTDDDHAVFFSFFFFLIPALVPDCALLALLSWTPLLCQMGS